MAEMKNLTFEQEVARSDDFGTRYVGRKAVCKRCHCVMNDREPSCTTGEFIHPSLDKVGKPYKCKNAGRDFYTTDTEVEPFLCKRERRFRKRNGIRL